MKAVEGAAKDYKEDGVDLFLVLDYDGVLNPSYTSGTYGKAYFMPDNRDRVPNADYKREVRRWGEYHDPYRYREPKSYAIQWSKELVGNFNQLLKDSRILVVWLTTWRAEMETVTYRLNMRAKREMVYLPWGTGPGEKYNQRFKSSALTRFMAGVNADEESAPARMIWTDDRLFDPTEGIDSDTPTLPLGDGNSLLVSPNEMYGISRAEWSLISDFALNRNSQA
jgi:hypothetical protein